MLISSYEVEPEEKIDIKGTFENKSAIKISIWINQIFKLLSLLSEKSWQNMKLLSTDLIKTNLTFYQLMQKHFNKFFIHS